ncbi:U3 small nucleolar RNA-associated protein 3 [Microdochium nivale]|nr:U3 small nucleolar RNA-associated protein 3 [Microdochium nivale]
MGKKRKVHAAAAQAKGGPKEYDPSDARLGAITSYKDIADDQERYFMDQDRDQDQILFDDAPQSKKQKRLQDDEDFLENSDDEVLAYDDRSDDDNDDDDEESRAAAKKQKPSRKNRKGGAAEEEEEEGDAGWWGSSRKEYYNNDAIETEADALEEEQEARRLQKKKLAKMSEEDFFNEDEWLGAAADEADDKDTAADDDVVTEVLKDVEIPADMPADERYRLLQNMYPELDYMADTLLELQPLLVSLQKEAEGQDGRMLAVVKYRILGCYVASLAMYFATLTAPSRDADGEAKPLSPAELRDHEVMATLLECREAWKRVEPLQSMKQSLSPPGDDVVSDLDQDEEAASAGAIGSLIVPSTKDKKKPTKRQAKADRKSKALEASLAELDSLVASHKKKPSSGGSSSKKVAATTRDDSDDSSSERGAGNNSDFGEEDALDARSAAEKAARKKSLRFYTSQIVQKASRRADAGRDAGGDVDLPYRERLRDRQARLNREAEKRGAKLSASGRGAELGGGDDDDEADAADQAKTAAAIRDNEDEYYDMVAARTSRKKEDKSARAAALATASATDRVVETETVDADGKRKITYAIEKNKGLAPKRNKDNRNPRVKKRKMYAEKQKKQRSMKAMYSGGEGKGGYGGELTGIKPGLIKSVKL